MSESDCTQETGPFYSHGTENRELSLNIEIDAEFLEQIEFARIYVTDSLKENPKCFQYNLHATFIDDKPYGVVELFDKSEVTSDTVMLNQRWRTINHVVDLLFDESGKFVISRWVADTEEEKQEFMETLEDYLNSKHGS